VISVEKADAQSLFRSRYNYFVARGDRWIGYNARLGSIAELAGDVVEALTSDGPLDHVRDAATLVELGFLHGGDEVQQVLDVYDRAKAGTHLCITLAPSLACNFSCSYCYQNSYRNTRVMSPAVQEATLSFIRDRVGEGRSDVVIEWFGGEPLLAKDLVLAMTPRIRETVEGAGGNLARVGMVTNGALLDAGTASELQAIGVGRVQVSFDSLYYIEGEKRGVIDPDGSPSPILRNVLTALPHLQLTLRINVGPENKCDVNQIVEVLERHGLGALLYLAKVDDFAGAAQDTTATGRTGTRRRIDLPIINVTSTGTRTTAGPAPDAGGGASTSDKAMPLGPYAKVERGVMNTPERVQHLLNKLVPKKHFCSATTGAMFVIDADGDVSRCWESAGVKSESIANVLTPHARREAREAIDSRWSEYNPLAYSACAKCKVLPLCMGGCSYPRVILDDNNAQCTSIKSQIRFCLEEVGRRLKLPERPEVDAG
jgi:uncharacterized protein